MSAQSIVFVTVDSLRADKCGFMGCKRDLTPSLDRLAKNGMIFENAISPGTKTPASLPVMFTGQYMSSQKSISGMDQYRRAIKSHIQTHVSLAERFARAGYATAAFTPNPWTSRHFGFNTGFHRFEDFLDEDRGSGLFERMLEGKGSTSANALRLLLSWVQRENTFKPWESFYDDAMAWVEEQDGPYFLWLFLLDPHFPYLSNRSNRSQSLLATLHSNLQLYLQDQDTPYSSRTGDRLVRAYHDSIRYMDGFFNRLMDDVGGEADIVVTADHGEAFGEHGTYGHHNQLYEENIHVPLVVSGHRWEGTVARPVTLRSLPKLLTGVSNQSVQYVRNISESVVPINPQSSLSGLRGRDWKYIGSENSEHEELYDLSSDPGETRNIVEYIDSTTIFRKLLSKRQQEIASTRCLSEEISGFTTTENNL